MLVGHGYYYRAENPPQGGKLPQTQTAMFERATALLPRGPCMAVPGLFVSGTE